jgi:hypothetical protein
MARCGRGTRSYRGRTQFSNSTSLSLHSQAPRKWYLRNLKMLYSVFIDAEIDAHSLRVAGNYSKWTNEKETIR